MAHRESKYSFSEKLWEKIDMKTVCIKMFWSHVWKRIKFCAAFSRKIFEGLLHTFEILMKFFNKIFQDIHCTIHNFCCFFVHADMFFRILYANRNFSKLCGAHLEYRRFYFFESIYHVLEILLKFMAYFKTSVHDFGQLFSNLLSMLVPMSFDISTCNQIVCLHLDFVCNFDIYFKIFLKYRPTL